MASKNSAKDQARAAYLKRIGDKRTSQRCPLCSRVVSNERFPDHVRASCRN